jgi:CMP-N,N'-diacetyllegionaminic acid synthase
VSTDSEEIAEVARCYGGDVPFLRPAELATDTAQAIEYVLHALNALESDGECYDTIMLLQPSAPIRNVEAIVAALERFNASQADSLISCYEEEYVNELVMYVDDGTGFLMPKNPNHNKGIGRQEHGPVIVRSGTLYLTRISYLRRTGRLIADRPMPMRIRKIEGIDLNSPDDLVMLRALLCESDS